MSLRWRPRQLEYNRGARKKLAEGGNLFRAWVIVILFYEVVIALDGYAEMCGMRAPRNHAERRAFVKRRLPHLARAYHTLYGLSLTARYNEGHAMTKAMWSTAVQCHSVLMKAIPLQ